MLSWQGLGVFGELAQMKIKKIILFILLAISLAACNETPQNISIALDLDKGIDSYFVDTWQEAYTELLKNFTDLAIGKEMEFVWHLLYMILLKAKSQRYYLQIKTIQDI